MSQIIGMLRLMRPANIVTAISDIIAGFAIAIYATNTEWSQLSISSILLLILSTIGLYGGGVVMNDVFDAELDKVERPERPIPSGIIDKKWAAVLGVFLLMMGIVTAALAHPGKLFSSSAIIAFTIAIAAVVYDKWAKHLSFFGPLNMGLCRGLNLLLGISIIPAALEQQWYIAIVPIIYIAAITMISRGEVHGGGKNILMGAVALYITVIGCILYFSIRNGTLLYVVLFLVVFSIMIFIPLQKAIRNPKGPLIGKAVKAGVIALIIMNATWTAAFGSLFVALFILLLLPVSILLAKVFMVT